MADEREFSLTTPSEYLAGHPTQQLTEPATSTWGEQGYFEVWLNQSNAWIYTHLHIAARSLSEAARRYTDNPTSLTDRVLQQLARELLLAQSSDWAFLMKTGTAREYATKRTMDHLARFNRLRDRLVANHVDQEFLGECECRDNLFPNVNWRYYA
jgi:1,4-alpha-glucan branching enzyme